MDRERTVDAFPQSGYERLVLPAPVATNFFDAAENVQPEIFEDIIGRHFREPKEGLGFDGSSVAHMWRTAIWPNNAL